MEEIISPSKDARILGSLLTRLEQFKAQREQAFNSMVSATIDVEILGKVLVEIKLKIKELERKGVKAPAVIEKKEAPAVKVDAKAMGG